MSLVIQCHICDKWFRHETGLCAVTQYDKIIDMGKDICEKCRQREVNTLGTEPQELVDQFKEQLKKISDEVESIGSTDNHKDYQSLIPLTIVLSAIADRMAVVSGYIYDYDPIEEASVDIDESLKEFLPKKLNLNW